MNCCDIPSYLKSLPQTWREELTSVLCEILQTETSVNCSTIKDCETLTSLTELSLNGSALSFTYFDERGSANFRTVDLSSIITPPVDCNFIKSCETLTGVSPLNLSGSILSFAYTDEAGTVNNRQVDLSPIIPAQFTLNTQDSNSIDFSGNGTVGTPLTASLKIETGQPFSITSGGLNLSTQNGLSINSNLLKLGGALTENTTFTNSFKMNWVGPSLHLGPDTTTQASNTMLNIVGRLTGTDDLFNVHSGLEQYKRFFRIRNSGFIDFGFTGDGTALGNNDNGGLVYDPNYTGGAWLNAARLVRNKPLLITGFGGNNSPLANITIESLGSTTRAISRQDSTIGSNAGIGRSIRFHVQHDKNDGLSTTESIGTIVSSSFQGLADSIQGRIINTSSEFGWVKGNSINLNVTGFGIFDDEVGNLNSKNFTSTLIDPLFSREDADVSHQGIGLSNTDIHIRTKYGQAAYYNVIGYHYNPDWDVTAPVSGNTEQAIRTERGVINFNNSDNKSYVKFPVHTEATRDTMSSGWGASEKGAQIFVTDGSSPNTMQYWNGTIWVVM